MGTKLGAVMSCEFTCCKAFQWTFTAQFTLCRKPVDEFKHQEWSSVSSAAAQNRGVQLARCLYLNKICLVIFLS